jgi:LytR cell envelope-related transcriptional attenuator
MTSEPPYSEHGGSNGGGRPGAGIAPVRAFVVLVIFVVAAIVLVGIGTRAPSSGDAAPPSTTTPTTTPHHGSTPTTTTTTVPHGSVSVLVANATQTNALAAHYSAILAAQGWAMQTPVDAATTAATSAVYYAANQQAAAATIAGTLGLKPAAVLALTTAVPVTGASGVDVVVVIGTDLVAQAG